MIWESMAQHKPIDPLHFNGIDYGYIVRVKEGEHAGKFGIAVMFSRFGDIGLKTQFPETPCFLNGYAFREEPENLEVVLKQPLTRKE